MKKSFRNSTSLESEEDIFLPAVLDFQPELEFTIRCSLEYQTCVSL